MLNLGIALKEIEQGGRNWFIFISRSEDFAELLSYVRLPLVRPNYFVNVVECDEQVLSNPECQSILQETRKYHILGLCAVLLRWWFAANSVTYPERETFISKKFCLHTHIFTNAGNEINSARTRPRRSTGCSAAVVLVGGYDRAGGYNMPYVEAFDPVTLQWGSLAKLPAFTKSEYAVASFRNSIIVSGGRIHSRDVWLYQVTKKFKFFHLLCWMQT